MPESLKRSFSIQTSGGAASLYGKVGTVKPKNGSAADIGVSILAARDATA